MPPVKGSSNSKKYGSNNVISGLQGSSSRGNSSNKISASTTAQPVTTMAKRLQKNSVLKTQKVKSSNKVSTVVGSSAGKPVSLKPEAKVPAVNLPRQQNIAKAVPFSSNFISQVRKNSILVSNLLRTERKSDECDDEIIIPSSFLEIIRYIS